jgi:hypothetical protein
MGRIATPPFQRNAGFPAIDQKTAPKLDFSVTAKMATSKKTTFWSSPKKRWAKCGLFGHCQNGGGQNDDFLPPAKIQMTKKTTFRPSPESGRVNRGLFDPSKI